MFHGGDFRRAGGSRPAVRNDTTFDLTWEVASPYPCSSRMAASRLDVAVQSRKKEANRMLSSRTLV